MKITIGAPALTGRDVNEELKPLQDCSYPLTLTFKNLMPRNVVFPEIDGLFLKHVAGKESEKTLRVASYEVLQRVASSVVQIATLNQYAKALMISGDIEGVEIEDTETGDTETAKATKKTTAKRKSTARKKAVETVTEQAEAVAVESVESVEAVAGDAENKEGEEA